MRAVVFDGQSSPKVQTVELAPPGQHEVLVDIVSAGVCHSDLHVMKGEWPVPTPLVMGHEGAGVVRAVGPGVSTLKVGDHVVLSWVASCGECRYCLAGRPVQCARYAETVGPEGVLFDGSTRLTYNGQPAYHYLGASTFAEQVVVPESGAIKVRDDAPLDVIALVGCAVATGIGAVTHTAQVPKGATVVVIGCGGVGLSCIQGARLVGASRIVAVDLVTEKLELARKLGASDVINVADGDAEEALQNVLPEGADFVFDAIGKPQTTEQAIRMLGLGGAAVVVGLPPAGSSASFDPLALAEADQKILGSNYGSIVPAVDIPKLVDAFMAGEIDLESMVSARRPLEEAAAALDDLANGGALRQLLMPKLGLNEEVQE